jgi:hypothetical protein
MTKSFQFALLLPELQLTVVDFLSFEDTIHLKMTSRKCHDLIPKPSHQQLLAAEQTNWAKERGLFTCCHCLRLRRGTKFSDSMICKKRAPGRRRASFRFCIECGLVVPWKDSGARGYSRGHQIRIKGRKYQVCKNCGLVEKIGYSNWYYLLCPHGYQSNRQRADLSQELSRWRQEYVQVLEELEIDPEGVDEISFGDIEGEKYRPLRVMRGKHGLPTNCI